MKCSGIEAFLSSTPQELGAKMKSTVCYSLDLSPGHYVSTLIQNTFSLKLLTSQQYHQPTVLTALRTVSYHVSSTPDLSSWLRLPLTLPDSEMDNVCSNSLVPWPLTPVLFSSAPLPSTATGSPRSQGSQAPLNSSAFETETWSAPWTLLSYSYPKVLCHHHNSGSALYTVLLHYWLYQIEHGLCSVTLNKSLNWSDHRQVAWKEDGKT